MAPGEYRELDKLVAALGAKVDAFQEHWRVQDARATLGREKVYEKIEELSNDFQGVRYEVRDVQNKVAEMKPTVDRLDELRVEATGIARVGRVGWLVIGALGSGALWAIDHWAMVEHLAH